MNCFFDSWYIIVFKINWIIIISLIVLCFLLLRLIKHKTIFSKTLHIKIDEVKLGIGKSAITLSCKKKIKKLHNALKNVLLQSFRDEKNYTIKFDEKTFIALEKEPKDVIVESFDKYNELHIEQLEQLLVTRL